MELDLLIARMERFGGAFPAMIDGIPIADARWKPPSGAWSILEIVCHLADEEAEDFRPRLQAVLRDPTEQWASINPEQAARDRRYNEQDLRSNVQRFVTERRRSIDWLRSLRTPDWSAVHSHPSFGEISAGMLMTSWAAHDSLHLRQIAKRLFELSERDGAPFSSRYAGEWGP